MKQIFKVLLLLFILIIDLYSQSLITIPEAILIEGREDPDSYEQIPKFLKFDENQSKLYVLTKVNFNIFDMITGKLISSIQLPSKIRYMGENRLKNIFVKQDGKEIYFIYSTSNGWNSGIIVMKWLPTVEDKEKQVLDLEVINVLSKMYPNGRFGTRDDEYCGPIYTLEYPYLVFPFEEEKNHFGKSKSEPNIVCLYDYSKNLLVNSFKLSDSDMDESLSLLRDNKSGSVYIGSFNDENGKKINQIEVGNFSNIKESQTFFEYDDMIEMTDISKDGKYIAAISRKYKAEGMIENLILLNIESKNSKILCSNIFLNNDKLLFGNMTSNLFFIQNSKYLISYNRRSISLWNSESLSKVWERIEYPITILSLIASNDGKYLSNILYNDKNAMYQCKVYSIHDLMLFYDNLSVFKEKTPELFKQKDEFESENEFQSRVKIANLKKDKLIESILINKEKTVKSQIESSKSEVILKIEKLISYNANEHTYLVQIDNQNYKIDLPSEDARSLKENYDKAKIVGIKKLLEDLNSYKYENLILIHPITNSNYKITGPIK